MIPCIMYEALDSPGWTRAEITTPLRRRIASASEAKLVIVRVSIVLPASVSHSGRRRKRLAVLGSVSSRWR